MKDIKTVLEEEKADLLEKAIVQAELAAAGTASILASLRKYGDHGVSVHDPVDALQRLARLLGAMGQNAKVAGVLERG